MNTLSILREDDDILIINKPSGITVNNADSNVSEDTIQKLVENKIVKNTGDEEFDSRGGIVHRLDKETSGILIIAKNPASFHNLKNQFKEREVKKTYVALAHGEITPKTGEISASVGRVPWDRRRFGVVPGGRPASTKYLVISYYKSPFRKETLTLLNLFPETGRTHQIRVHLKYINKPIFSDPLYSGRKVSREDRNLLARVFLHAKAITFKHPKTNETIQIESDLSPDLENFLNMLKYK